MNAGDGAARVLALTRLTSDGVTRPIERPVAVEVPLSIEYGGIAYAVMMVSPTDLEDFVTGFSLTEGLIGCPADIEMLDIAEIGLGWIARVALRSGLMERISERARTRVSEGSCGLCGLENLEQVMRPLPPLTDRPKGNAAAIFAALEGLSAHQPLTRATGAAHAAAFCAPDGTILLAREDIGRHNALDKLIGALVRSGANAADGFLLLTARCSYELVEKTILAGCPMLVTISAPSTLAIARAADHGLTLVALARPDAVLVANDPHGLFPTHATALSSGRK